MSEASVILFAGGGTGGHLYPGLAIAERVREMCERAGDEAPRMEFLCSERAIDRSILERAGVAFEAIPAKPMLMRPMGLARFVASWGPSVRAAREAIRRARGTKHKGEGARVVMASMGGFVAAPCVQAARAERVPVVMVNLDAVPGKANRWIAKRADRVLSAVALPGRSWEVVGPIVRREAVNRESPEACRLALGLDARRQTLVVTGGSQGATSLNEFLGAFARAHADLLTEWQVLHQAGKDGGASVEAAYREAGVRASVREFVSPMAPAWGSATLAIARCGAGTVAEIWANRVASLLLPYPFHRDDHQRANARALEEAGLAIVRTDHVDAAANLRDAGEVLTALLREPARIEAMRAKGAALGPADGAGEAARAVLEAIGRG